MEDRQWRVPTELGDALTEGVDEDAQRHDRGDQQEQGRQPVGNKADADAGRPTTDVYGLGSVPVGLHQEGCRDRDDDAQGDQADDPLGPGRAAEDEAESGAEQGDDDGQQDELVHVSAPSSSSSPP